jgi:hypothetical protein
VKHLLIILISLLLLTSFLTSCEKNGHGTKTFDDGSTYVGEFKDGKRHGQGKHTWSNIDGSIDQQYTGEYENGKKHGKGILLYTDGGYYHGLWKDGEKHGQGRYKSSDETVFEGDYKSGLLNGQGRITTNRYPNDGYEYVGEFKDSTMNGQGVLTFSTGTKYVGDWKEGKEWNTTHTDKDGTLLGMYKNGEWELKYGMMYYGIRNFELRWREEEWEGVESEENKDMITYMGEVKNGVPNGQGTQLFPDGWKYVGEVWGGERWKGTTYDQDGNFKNRWVNGKVVYE